MGIEAFESDSVAQGYSGSTLAGGVRVPTTGEQPWTAAANKALASIDRALRMASSCQVHAETTALECGVRAGRYRLAGAHGSYAGATEQGLTDDATNYIYLDLSAGVGSESLTINTTGWPDISVPHIRLATIACGTASASGASGYRVADITDYRATAVLHCDARVLAEQHVDLRDLVGDGTLVDNGWGTGGLHLAFGDVQDDSRTYEVRTVVALPADYVADADVRLIANAHYDDGDGGTAGTVQIDAEVYALADDGTVGSDLCATAAQDLADAAADETFVVTDSGLAAGDRLQVYLRVTVQESGDSGTLYARLNSLRLACDRAG